MISKTEIDETFSKMKHEENETASIQNGNWINVLKMKHEEKKQLLFETKIFEVFRK